jgi:glycosyltransferase involved in cell wall biosynthesis
MSNVRVTVLPAGRSRIASLIWLQLRLPFRLKEDRVNVFYSSFYFLPLLSFGTKLVNTIHDVCFFYLNKDLHLGSITNPVFLFLLRPFMWLMTLKANEVITVSEFSAFMICRHLGVPAKKLFVCYHGIDETLYRKTRPLILNGNLRNQYCLFVGKNMPKKNIRRMIDAYGRMPPSIRDRYNLVLKTVPSESDYAQLEALHLEGCVHFVSGNLSIEEMGQLYAHAALVILLSLDEGFGLPIAEAFAAGIPVLVADNSACRELVEMEDCRVDPEDVEAIAPKWERLLVDEQLRLSALRQQAYKFRELKQPVAMQRFFSVLAPLECKTNAPGLHQNEI